MADNAAARAIPSLLSMFDIRDIEILRAIVEHGGFRAAAQRLRLSQSAVSARVAALEDRLGTEILDRARRGGRLTPAGRTFFEQTMRLTEMRDHIIATLSQDAAFAGTIRIGVAETIVHTWLPAMLTGIHGRYPRLRIELSVDTSKVLADKLLCDDIDLAIMMRELVPGSAEASFIYASSTDWFAAPGVAPDGPLRIEDLARWPIVTFPKGTVPYHDVEALFARAHATEMPMLHGCASLSTAFHLVRSGFGLGLLPVSMAEPDLAAGSMVRLTTESGATPPPLQFVFCHLVSMDAGLVSGLREAAESAVRSLPT